MANKKRNMGGKRVSKKNDLVLVFISAFTLLLIGAFVYLNFFYDDNKENNYKEVDNFSEMSVTFNNLMTENKLDNVARLEKNIYDFNKLTNDEKLNIVYRGIFDENAYTYGVKVDDMNTYFEKVFYDNITWVKDGIKCTCDKDIYVYDTDTNKYIYNSNHDGHGVSDVASYFSKIIKIENNGNFYRVTEVKLWELDLDSGPASMTLAYDTAMDADDEDNSLFEVVIPENLDISDDYNYYLKKEINDNFDNYKDKMARYIYTFEKVDNKYLLVSFEFQDK